MGYNNPFAQYSKRLSKAASNAAVGAAQNAGEILTEELKSALISSGHVGSGELVNSLQFEVTREDDTVYVRCFSDAEADNGVKYIDFIENGTGIYREGGRRTPWRYQDRNGDWHTTSGMEADPFAEPVREEAANIIKSEFKELLRDYLVNGD